MYVLCIIEIVSHSSTLPIQGPMCRKPLDKKDIFLGSAFEPTEDEVDKIYVEITGNSQPYKRIKFSPETSELDGESSTTSSSKGKVGTPCESVVLVLIEELQGKATAKTEQLEAKLAEDEVAAMVKSSKFEPSTKMVRMMNLVIQWRKEAPEDKVIIYSQCKFFSI